MTKKEINIWDFIFPILMFIAGCVLTAEILMDITPKKLDTPQGSLTNKEVVEIYNNLIKYTGISKENMPNFIIIQDDSTINAYQDSGNNTIAVYTGMIKFVSSKDELAGVIGHEIGHFMLEHSKLNPDGDPNYQAILEGNSDKFGIYLMLRAGYDVCKTKDLWDKLRDKEGDYEYNSDHPNYSYRYWELSFPNCGDIK